MARKVPGRGGRTAAGGRSRATALLQSVLESSPTAVALLRGPGFRHQLVNPAYQRFDPRRAFLGRTYAECWPEAADRVLPTLRKLLRDGVPFHATDVRFELARGPGGAVEEAFFSYTFLRVDPDASGEPGILVTAVETTEQVRARHRVEEAEERLRLALDASGSGMWEWDLATGENVWSDSLWDLYGLRRDGRKPSYELWRDSIHPSDRERVETEVLEASGEGRPLELEYRVVAAGAGERWLVARGRPVRDGSGAVTRYRGVAFDVTALKRAAMLVAEGNRLVAVQEAVANLDVGFAVVEACEGGTFRLVSTNAAYRAITGTAPDRNAALGDLPHALYEPDRVVPVPFHDWPGPAAARSGEPTRSREYHLRRADGSWRIVSTSAAPVGAPEPGRPRQAVALIVDVTDRVRAEAELRASEARFRDVAASAGEYVFEMDPRGVVTYISDAAEKVLGWRPDEIVGHSSFEFMDPEDVARSGAYLADKAARKERITRLEQVALHRAGHRVYLEISAVPVLGVDGSLLGYRGAAMDVTERREAEAGRARLQEQLAQSQKMEVVGRLAGGVAHDFNNLLTVILTCGLELRADLEAGRPGDPEQAADVVSAAQRAADLTRQLLAFARREATTPEVLDLNEVLRQAAKLVGRVIGEDVRIVEAFQDDLWKVRCDRGLIGQVVMNLAVNARDAMPGGGTLHLRTANRRFGLREPLPSPEMIPGDWVEFRVRDDGQGMSRDVLDHAFEPFYTTKPAGSGTGLGLATVYGIVRQAGGVITVDSAPGAGTEFHVFLPALPPGTPRASAPPVVARGGTESILVVEDEPRVRQATAHVLRSAGYQVHEAAGGEEALAWLRSEAGTVDLVATDVVMPGMGGRDLARAVEALRPGTRVLYLSGFTQDATLRQGVLAEGLDFLAKPFTPDALRTKVREVLDRR